MFKGILYTTTVIVGAAFFRAPLQASAASSTSFNRPLVFEPNHGQFAPEVQWMGRGPAYQIFIANDGATFALWENVKPEQRTASARRSQMPEAPMAHLSTMRMTLNGSRRWEATGLESTGGFSNYLVGGDSKRWRTGIPQYGRVKVSAVYPGIDVVFHGANNDLEYDFVVAPGADPAQIRLSFSGADGLQIDEHTGDLVTITPRGVELRMHRPQVYQEIGGRKVAIPGAYAILESGEVAFTLATYDTRHSLVIDPIFHLFATWIRGNGEDFPNAIAVDPSGNSYITGFTFSSDYPQTSGGFGALPGKSCIPTVNDLVCPPYAFITKFSPTGQMLFSTLFGGSNTDIGNAIAVDFNSIYVAGVTSSENFTPAFNSPYHGGAFDAFAMRLSTLGNQFDYAVLLGGSDIDAAFGIAIDAAQSAVVVGSTHSADFPTTSQAMQKTKAGGTATRDGFMTKLSAAGAIISSSYFGGSDDDEAVAVALDRTGFVHVTGDTSSTDFPHFGTSHGAPSGNGTFTAFFAKLVPDLSIAVNSITLGGGLDQGRSIALDTLGNIYITGNTASALFPTTGGALQRFKPAPSLDGVPTLDAFVVGLNSASNLQFSTYLGGSDGGSLGAGIGVNALGQVYVSGVTFATDFPGGTPSDPPHPSNGFLVKLNHSLSSIGFRDLFGAEIKSIALPPPSRSRFVLSPVFGGTLIYATGFGIRPGTDANNNANDDAFVLKVSEPPALPVLIRRN